ncbi:hypothetical protein E2C01_050181 [Portunus trituberculatus]|uniref:Uncharacterized protein n=1 Tax=Portunus trituberculatus TaxID=210409 RepID=A0A5B7GGL5_PORTR|nr:hypothetical protein [Portunus trituberculatus]
MPIRKLHESSIQRILNNGSVKHTLKMGGRGAPEDLHPSPAHRVTSRAHGHAVGLITQCTASGSVTAATDALCLTCCLATLLHRGAKLITGSLGSIEEFSSVSPGNPPTQTHAAPDTSAQHLKPMVPRDRAKLSCAVSVPGVTAVLSVVPCGSTAAYTEHITPCGVLCVQDWVMRCARSRCNTSTAIAQHYHHNNPSPSSTHDQQLMMPMWSSGFC